CDEHGTDQDEQRGQRFDAREIVAAHTIALPIEHLNRQSLDVGYGRAAIPAGDARRAAYVAARFQPAEEELEETKRLPVLQSYESGPVAHHQVLRPEEPGHAATDDFTLHEAGHGCHVGDVDLFQQILDLPLAAIPVSVSVGHLGQPAGPRSNESEP